MRVAAHLLVWAFVGVLCVLTVRSVTRTLAKDGFTRWQVILSGVGWVLVFAAPAVGVLFEPRGVDAAAWAARLTLGAAAVCVSIPLGAHYRGRFRRPKATRLPAG